MAEIKRSLVKHFLNSTPSATAATYELFGDGVLSLTPNYNPNTVTEQYISEDSGHTLVQNYAPTMPVTMRAFPGDDLFDFIDDLRQTLSIGGDDLTDVIEVRLYETPESDNVTYPATQWDCSIQFESGPGGDGGANAELAFTINFTGDPVQGDFNISTLAFTPDA
jgi:hypothetical protein